MGSGGSIFKAMENGQVFYNIVPTRLTECHFHQGVFYLYQFSNQVGFFISGWNDVLQNSGIEPTKKETVDDLENHLKHCIQNEKKVVFQVLNHKAKAKKLAKHGHKVSIVDISSTKAGIKPVFEPKGPTRTREQDEELMLLKRQLQTIIGKSPKLAIKEFVNWGKTQKANVISCHPTNKEEVSIVIQAVNEYKGKVKIRCAGSCHSWSPLFADSNNVLIYVDKIKSDYEDKSKIRMSNKETCEVDIMTGVTTDELRNFELKHNVNLDANVILEAVQMVSVVATGCHGVGRGTMSPSDHVVRMRIFDSEGELRTYYKDEDPELFKAVAANFGCFGVIFDMTMKLKPLRIVKTQNTYHRLGEIFQSAYMMKEMVEENWSVELFWFPYNSFSHVDNYDPAKDEIWVRQINDETKQVGLKQHKFYRNKAFVDYVTSHELAAMTPILVQHPKLTPLFSFFGCKTIKAIIDPVGPIHQELPQAIHFRRYIHLAPVNDMEFAFDVGDDYEKVIQIINVVVSKVKDSITEQKFPLNIALEMRFMGYSEACLCPANIGNPETGGTGQVFYCEVLSVSGTPGWEDFCIYVAEEWMKLGGIPHLAKEWSFIPNVEKAIKTKMMKGITSFTTQLSKSGADPNGMFLNSTLQRLLFEPISEL